MRMNWPVSLETVEWLWTKLTNGGGNTGKSSVGETEESHPLAQEAIELLFDFDTSPVAYDIGAQSDRSTKSYDYQNDRMPPGIAVQQDIFLERLQTANVHPEPIPPPGDLDKFAMALADLKQYDGVYCLSGVRGSGKSSVLNRVAWYCNNWYSQTGKPLLVRFDLGTNFNREIFVRDLVAEICLATKKAFRYPPFSLGFGASLATRALGHLGRFCQVNIPWALVASLLVGILLHSAQWVSEKAANGCAAAGPGVEAVFFPENTADCRLQIPFLGNWSEGEIKIILLVMLGSIAVGLIYGAKMSVLTRRYSIEHGLALVFGPYGAIKALNAIIVLLGIFVVGNILVGWPFQGSWNGIPYSYVWNLSLIGVAIMLLPKWWGSYLFFDNMLSRIRSEPAKPFPEMPVFGLIGPVSAFISQLLPASDSRDQLDSVSEPFIQELTKQTLAECIRNFDRVVILIDDIDALPSEKFHELLRLVRPLGKVRGTRCLLATPLYFHFALKQSNYGDIHSTVRASVVVGNRTIHDKWPSEPKRITENDQVLSEFLVKLLVSRLRLRLRAEDINRIGDIKSAVAESSPFRFLLKPWIGGNGEEPFERIRLLFSEFGTSRREIIRAVGNSIRPEVRAALNDGSFSESLRSASSPLNDLKRDYQDQESLLDCDNESAGTSGGREKSDHQTAAGTQKKPPARRRPVGKGRRGSSKPDEGSQPSNGG
ncbi:MAG: P-loop NTPase fold protein [Rhodospirillales bacterium]|nr:P-loop NTPase fold protein [Rhodospirillales bacterium]